MKLNPLNHVFINIQVRKEEEMINTKNTYWLLKPFAWLWNLIATIVMLTGRLVAVLLGLLLMLGGVLLTITVVGAIIGIPLFIVGGLLVVRGLW
jgi:hypothetical protein